MPHDQPDVTAADPTPDGELHEVGDDAAPACYSNQDAAAWAAGYNSAVDDARRLLARLRQEIDRLADRLRCQEAPPGDPETERVRQWVRSLVGYAPHAWPGDVPALRDLCGEVERLREELIDAQPAVTLHDPEPAGPLTPELAAALRDMAAREAR